jgi:hypothetical protein
VANIPFQFRGGTAAQATAANPILAAREMVIETDTTKFKIGDGVTAWNSLPYGGIAGAAGATGPTGATGAAGAGVTDHALLTNIGTNTHAQIDTDLVRLAGTSGTNTGNEINFVSAVNSATPNATIPVVSWTNANAAASVDLALVPKGTGAILAQVPDNTAAGGNKRGSNAVDFQVSRTTSTMVASGQNSFIVGQNNTASALNAVAMGLNNTASDNYCIALGYLNNATNVSVAIGSQSLANGYKSSAIGNNPTASGSNSISIGGVSPTASGTNSVCMGSSSTSDGVEAYVMGSAGHAFGIFGKHIRSSGCQVSVGDAQNGTMVLRQITTDATASIMTCGTPGQNAASSTNQLILQNNQAVYFKGMLMAKQSASTNAASWEVEGMVVRSTTAASTVLTYSAVTLKSNASTWGMPTLLADTTLGGLKVTIIGLAATNIKWTLVIQTSETLY